MIYAVLCPSLFNENITHITYYLAHKSTQHIVFEYSPTRLYSCITYCCFGLKKSHYQKQLKEVFVLT